VIRTFSKAYGLAGLRVGYAVTTPDTARRLSARSLSANVTAPAASAAAVAVDDTDYLRTIVARNRDDRQEFLNAANARMYQVIDSQTNFVMLNTVRPAKGVVDHFARNGIALPPPFAPLDNYMRVSIGTPSDMREFWRVWDLMGLGHGK
jgi:histidinol-phosphate aminotransferase